MKKRLVILWIIISSFFILPMVVNENVISLPIKKLITQETSSLDIMTTIAIPYDIAMQIVGDNVDIESIVDSSTDIHSFDGPTQMQINHMIECDVIFSMGISGAEPWLAPLVADYPNLADKIVNLTNIDDGYADSLLDGSINPHVWMNPNVAMKMGNVTKDKLIELDPLNSDSFIENYNAFEEKINTLMDDIYANKTAIFQGLKVVVNHPAFYYLFDLLGIERIAVIESHDGGEPGQAHIDNVIKLMESENCSLIISSPQHSSDHVNVIARETGAKIANMSPIPGKYSTFEVLDYISMIEYCIYSLQNPINPPQDVSISIVVSILCLTFMGITVIRNQKK